MEGDKFKADDPVLDVPRDLFSITAFLVGFGSWGAPAPSAWG